MPKKVKTRRQEAFIAALDGNDLTVNSLDGWTITVDSDRLLDALANGAEECGPITFIGEVDVESEEIKARLR